MGREDIALTAFLGIEQENNYFSQGRILARKTMPTATGVI